MRGFLRSAALTVACAAGMAAGPAWADGIEVQHLAFRATERGFVLDADFALELSPRLVDMVSSGVPVYFVVEFELTRERWYWLDENTASRSLHLRLSYHALSRQYRISTGLLQQSFSTLEEALHLLTRVRNWLVVERAVPLAQTDYEAAVRMRLDATLLPKPFQLSALTSRELQLESPWKRFIVRSPRHVPAPVENRAPEERE